MIFNFIITAHKHKMENNYFFNIPQKNKKKISRNQTKEILLFLRTTETNLILIYIYWLIIIIIVVILYEMMLTQNFI